MARTIQVWVSDDLAERVVRAAAKDQRSVSEWVRLLLVRELGDPGGRVTRPAGRAPCAHGRTVKRMTGALGTRTFCEDCGSLVP